MTPPALRSLSVRDPAGKLVDFEGRLLRTVDPSHEPALANVESSSALREKTAAGHLISFRRLEASEIPWEPKGIVLEHPRVWFPTYPHEWPAEMLRRVGELTLDLAEASLETGLGLKDATPWNVLFRGTEPVFVDLLSFENRHPEDGTWLALAQFMRTFLYPLLAEKELGLACHEVFSTHRDGWEAESLYRLIGWSKRLRPPFLGLISLPTWLSGKAKRSATLYEPRLTGDPEKAKFLLNGWYARLRRLLGKVAPKENRPSKWSFYESSVEASQIERKERFLAAAIEAAKPKRFLDLGCNAGRYSFVAARRKVETVAVDNDPAVLGRLWSRAREERIPLLPMLMDLARPSPAMGWNNREALSFAERAEGRFDLILAYAVLHHMWVTEGIPMEGTFEWLHSFKAPHLVTEYVSPQDARVEELRRGRQLGDLSAERFEAAASAAGFALVAKEPLPGGTRTLYRFARR